MSLQDKLDKALGLKDADIDNDITEETDSDLIEKHNQRKKKIESLKQNLKDARSMGNKDWAEAILKKTVDNLIITQEIFTEEIEDNPRASNVTAQGDISNALTSAVKEVMELDREEERIAIRKEANDIRRMEALKNAGAMVDAESGNVIGTGSADDLLKALKTGAIDVDASVEDNINTDEETSDEQESTDE